MFPWLPVVIQCKKRDFKLYICRQTLYHNIRYCRLNWKEIAVSQDCNEEDDDNDDDNDDDDIFILPQGGEYT